MPGTSNRPKLQIPQDDFERLDEIAKLHGLPTNLCGVMLLRAAMASRHVDAMLAGVDTTGLVLRRRNRGNKVPQWTAASEGMWSNGDWVLMKDPAFLHLNRDAGEESWWWLMHQSNMEIRKPMAFKRADAIEKADEAIMKLEEEGGDNAKQAPTQVR